MWGKTANESIYQLPPSFLTPFFFAPWTCDLPYSLLSIPFIFRGRCGLRIFSSVLKVFPLDVGVLGRRGGDDGDGGGRGRRSVLSTLGRGPEAAKAAAVAVVVPAIALVLGSGFL